MKFLWLTHHSPPAGPSPFLTGHRLVPIHSLGVGDPGLRNFLLVRWLGLRVFTAKGSGSIPGQGTKIPHAVQSSQITCRLAEVSAFQNIAFPA